MQITVYPTYTIRDFLVLFFRFDCHGPLTRDAKLRVVLVSGIPRTFSPSQHVSDPDMHHGPCVMHLPWCMPRLLTSGFLWSRWRGKCSWHFRRMRHPQFRLCRKRRMALTVMICRLFLRYISPCKTSLSVENRGPGVIIWQASRQQRCSRNASSITSTKWLQF